MENFKNVIRPLYVPVANILYLMFRAPRRYHHLFDEIEKIKASVILEVGTWNGERALQMIAKAQAGGQAVHYIGFDLFEDLSEVMYHHELSKRPPSLLEVREKLEKTGAKITLVKGNTLVTLPEFIKNNQTVDFIFIDGGHHVDTVRNDWNAVKELMGVHTVVIFDDYWRNRSDQSAKPVVDAIDVQKYRVEILSEIDVFENPDFGHLEISFAKVVLR
jgi:predicted O-methyltransferase YrrM